MAADQLTQEKKKARVSFANLSAEEIKAHKREINRAACRKYSAKNPDKAREAARRRFEADPEGRREQQRLSMAKWRAANPEKNKEAQQKWRKQHPEHQRDYRERFAKAFPEKAREREAIHKARVMSTAKRMALLVRGARSRAKKSGKEFDEQLRHLAKTVPSACACCSIPFDYTRTNRSSAPSLDRFDNDKGYTAANVFVICRRCNVLKNDATLEELEVIVAWMRKVAHLPLPQRC